MLPDKEFATFWQNANSAEEVAELVGQPVDTVRHRAVRLRKAGFPLKSMRMPTPDITSLSVVALQMIRKPVQLEHTDYVPTQREFVIIWQLAESAKQAARLLNMPYRAVLTRAKVYRQQGVPLKRYNEYDGNAIEVV